MQEQFCETEEPQVSKLKQKERDSIQNKMGIEIDSQSPILPWIIRHVAWTVSRYLVHASDKQVAFFRRCYDFRLFSTQNGLYRLSISDQLFKFCFHVKQIRDLREYSPLDKI